MKTLLTTLLCLLSWLPWAHAQNIKSLNWQEIPLAELNQIIQSEVERHHMAGLSMAIINDEKVVYEQQWGSCHWGKQKPVISNTLFEGASMTKPVFGFLVMKLVEQGILELDKPLYQYWPYPELEHDDRYQLITARMVLTHTTGLPNWASSNELNLSFDPGTDFQYSGEAFVFLGKVIVHLTERSLEELAQSYIFQPLEMTQTSLVWSPQLAPFKAMGHYQGNVPSVDHYRPRLSNPAASILTTPTDFCKFMLAVMQTKLLKPASYEELLKVQYQLPKGHSRQNESNSIAWGLGWVVEQTPWGIKYQHGGNNGDFTSYFELSQDQKFGYVFFTNSDKGNVFNQRIKHYLNTAEEPKGLNEATQSPHFLSFNTDNFNFKGNYEIGNFHGQRALYSEGDTEAIVKAKSFKNMIVEFDISMERGYAFAGLKFRQKDSDN